MNDQKVLRFYGSKSDLQHLEAALSKAGFKKHEDNIIRASSDPREAMIAILIAVGKGIGEELGKKIGEILKTFLQRRRKRIVPRNNPEGRENIEVSGSNSVDEIEKVLAENRRLDVKNAQKQLKKTLKRKTRKK